jgi:hypothetical protein
LQQEAEEGDEKGGREMMIGEGFTENGHRNLSPFMSLFTGLVLLDIWISGISMILQVCK